MPDKEPRLGAKVRALRRRENLSQVLLAEKLGISASYLNLIENNRRPLPAPLLIKLAQLFNVELSSFASDEDARLVADLLEAFADPLFEEQGLTSVDVREMSTSSPPAARAVLVPVPRVSGIALRRRRAVVAPDRGRGAGHRRALVRAVGGGE